jgi:hypothetical protein
VRSRPEEVVLAFCKRLDGVYGPQNDALGCNLTGCIERCFALSSGS